MGQGEERAGWSIISIIIVYERYREIFIFFDHPANKRFVIEVESLNGYFVSFRTSPKQ
jgi:hypothetical protein